MSQELSESCARESESESVESVACEHEHVYAASMPDNYDPFSGTPCIEDYAARKHWLKASGKGRRGHGSVGPSGGRLSGLPGGSLLARPWRHRTRAV